MIMSNMYLIKLAVSTISDKATRFTQVLVMIMTRS